MDALAIAKKLTTAIMRFRKLRFAWSVGCGVAFLLVVALWARSYSGVDEFGGPLPGDMQYTIISARGFLAGDVGFVNGPDDRFDYGFIREPPAEDDIASVWRLVAPYGFSTWNHQLNFRVPNGSALIFLGMFAALPWVRWSRRI